MVKQDIEDLPLMALEIRCSFLIGNELALKHCQRSSFFTWRCPGDTVCTLTPHFAGPEKGAFMPDLGSSVLSERQMTPDCSLP